MKRIFTIAALMCTLAFNANAQEVPSNRNQSYKILLGKIQYAHHNDEMSAGDAVGAILTGVVTGQTSIEATGYEEDVRSAIVRGLSGAHRFRFSDELPKTGADAQEGNLVVEALITNIHTKSDSRRWKDKDGDSHVETSYSGVVNVLLTIKDEKTGEVIANAPINGHGMGNNLFSASTSDKAIRGAIDQVAYNITRWLNKFRPLTANIIEGAAVKKNKQKEVYIDFGSAEGAQPGLRMAVYEVKYIAGREAMSEIGRLRIEAVEGVDISRCKITSGGKDIKEALDAGAKLRVASID